MIKIGLIGAGFMGKMHAACYEALADKANFRITAVADDDAEQAAKLAARFGAEVYDSGAKLIREADVNTIDICLPTFLHTEHALLAMEQGHHLFIEKPVCLEEHEAQRLLEMQRKTAAQVMVGHCIRFWPEYQYLKSVTEQGAYGKMISGVFRRVSPRPSWGWQNWLNDRKRSGSAALDLYIHDVDYMRYLLGEPDHAVSAASGGYADHLFSIYKYGDVVVTLEGGWGYPQPFPFDMSYRVRFEQATLTFSSAAGGGVDVYTESGEHIRPEIVSDMKEQANSGGGEAGGNLSELGGYYNELAYFLRCLSEGEPITVSSLEEGVASFRLTRREIASALGND